MPPTPGLLEVLCARQRAHLDSVPKDSRLVHRAATAWAPRAGSNGAATGRRRRATHSSADVRKPAPTKIRDCAATSGSSVASRYTLGHEPSMFTARSYGARGRLLWLVPLSGLVVLAGSQAIDVRRPPLANMASRPRPRPLEVGDADRDGIADGEELALAARFAPIVVLDPADRYRPASLPWLLERLPAGEVPLKQRLPQLLARARRLPRARAAGEPRPARLGHLRARLSAD